jgi:hypothetical protein
MKRVLLSIAKPATAGKVAAFLICEFLALSSISLLKNWETYDLFFELVFFGALAVCPVTILLSGFVDGILGRVSRRRLLVYASLLPGNFLLGILSHVFYLLAFVSVIPLLYVIGAVIGRRVNERLPQFGADLRAGCCQIKCGPAPTSANPTS